MKVISKKVIGEVTVERPVYDISVKDNHNYCVTKSDIPVHNSGKGFASENFMEIEKYKRRDVDEWKKTFMKIQELGIGSAKKSKGKYPEIAGLDLTRPGDVKKLHFFIDKLGIKDKSLDLLLNNADPDHLPNIMFDITAKNIKSITKVIDQLKEVGYQAEDIHLAWILTNYEVAVVNNKNPDRGRIVPDNIMIQTHTGAANTMWDIVSGNVPKGLNGSIKVILNNPEHTIYWKDSKGKDILVTDKKGKQRPVIKDFKYLTVKEEGSPIKKEKAVRDELYKWVINNIPQSLDYEDKETGKMVKGTQDIFDVDKTVKIDRGRA